MSKSVEEVALLGEAYQRRLEKSLRRKQGIFYTPVPVATKLVETILTPLLAQRNTPKQLLALRVCDPAMGGGVFVLEACRQLAEHLAELAKIPVSEARKQVARQCLTGVDLDPGAVAVARRSLADFTGLPEAAFFRIICADSLKSHDDPAVFPPGGIDALIGNPPFLGGRKIRRMLGDDYFHYLTQRFAPGVSGNADLCAFFLRLAGRVLRRGGLCGFITTHSVSEGDTRKVGLDFLVNDCGAVIFHAQNPLPWVGDAGVHVAVVCLKIPGTAAESSPEPPLPCMLNGVPVTRISPSLRETEIPSKMQTFPENKSLCFQGHVLAGKGFLLSARDGEALIARNPGNRDVIFPYFTGEEMFHQASPAVRRMVIHFQDWPLHRAEEYPEALEILRQNVLPTRKTARRQRHRRMWWCFGDSRPVLSRILRENAYQRIIVQTRHCKHFIPTFVETGFPQNAIFSESAVIFPSDSPLLLAVLNSDIYEIWVRQTSSSLGRELRFTPTQSFYTFLLPFSQASLKYRDARPENENTRRLAELGETLHSQRMAMTKTRNLGLSPLYDLFHAPDVSATDILRLREIHVQINLAVAEAYWPGENHWKILTKPHIYGFHPTARGIRRGLGPEMEKTIFGTLLARIRRRTDGSASPCENPF